MIATIASPPGVPCAGTPRAISCVAAHVLKMRDNHLRSLRIALRLGGQGHVEAAPQIPAPFRPYRQVLALGHRWPGCRRPPRRPFRHNGAVKSARLVAPELVGEPGTSPCA